MIHLHMGNANCLGELEVLREEFQMHADLPCCYKLIRFESRYVAHYFQTVSPAVTLFGKQHL